MDEQEKEITAEEKLKQLNDERKILKAQVSSEREIRLKEAAEMRSSRDKKQEIIKEKLGLILSAIFKYNKLGKVDKDKCDIFEIIREFIKIHPDDADFVGVDVGHPGADESDEELAEVHSEKIE